MPLYHTGKCECPWKGSNLRPSARGVPSCQTGRGLAGPLTSNLWVTTLRGRGDGPTVASAAKDRSGTWTRTTTAGVKGPRPTIRRFPSERRDRSGHRRVTEPSLGEGGRPISWMGRVGSNHRLKGQSRASVPTGPLPKSIEELNCKCLR